MTDEDIDIGEAALKAYVERVDGFEAWFVQEQAYRDGAIDVIKVMDASGASTDTNALYTACGQALYKAISDAGYSNDVTLDQCVSGATAVVEAVVAGRTKKEN